MDELIHYFKNAQLPPFPVKINAFMTVGPDFVANQTAMALAGNISAQLRLEQFQDYLESQKTT